MFEVVAWFDIENENLYIILSHAGGLMNREKPEQKSILEEQDAKT